MLSLRPRATRWFEVITTRRDLGRVMQALAETGAVELEAEPLEGVQPVLPQLDGFFAEFAALEKKYAGYWPQAAPAQGVGDEEPAALLDAILHRLRLWGERAGPEIAESQRLETDAGELELWRDLVAAAGGYPFAGLPSGGAGILSRGLFHVAGEGPVDPATEGLLIQGFRGRSGVFFAAIGEARDMGALRSELAALRGKELSLPGGLPESGEGLAERIEALLSENARAQAGARARIARISEEMALADVLSRVALFRWLRQHCAQMQGSDWTLRITGWIDPDGADKVAAGLEGSGADTVLSLSAGPGGAPMVLSNPAWLKPFEFFPRLLGIPGSGEADPSLITALITPIMFGYMFGDAGQGAVLIAIGLWGRKRMPLLALLVPGGIMAVVFGLLFGSVFSREDIVPALWLHPLHEPLTVLGVALAMGIAVLLGGVVLDAVQAVWHGRLGAWARESGGTLLAYLSVLGAFWQPALIWGLAVGLAWTVAGARDAEGRRSGMAVAGALGEFVEVLMRLLVSSVSFARVGAFALAHAGLSAAIVGMSDAAGGAVGLVILALGNVLIIALEGLVTGIQITRLVLFEFFTRFFKASGREFHPLDLPDQGYSSRNGEVT
ncbi:MAG: hypothetical protein R3D85_14755 [Paracoccaceae bacterium]